MFDFFNPSTRGRGRQISEFEPGLQRDPRQPGLHTETMSQKNKPMEKGSFHQPYPVCAPRIVVSQQCTAHTDNDGFNSIKCTYLMLTLQRGRLLGEHASG